MPRTNYVLVPIKQSLWQLLFSLHLFNLNRCADLLPAPYGNECWYHNPRTVCADEVCPEVERTGPEVEAI
uniref:Secreted protein n=1 Tax=Arundo donax TaxID=35708 RepID=A0A0A9CNS8_ARUDO